MDSLPDISMEELEDVPNMEQLGDVPEGEEGFDMNDMGELLEQLMPDMRNNPPQSRSSLTGLGHLLWYCTEDLPAQTTDPEVLKHHFHIPLSYFCKVKHADGRETYEWKPDPQDVFIMSEEFFLKSTNNDPIVVEALRKMEPLRGYNNRTVYPSPVIKRKQLQKFAFKMTTKKVETLEDFNRVKAELFKEKDEPKKKRKKGESSQALKAQDVDAAIVSTKYSPVQVQFRSVRTLKDDTNMNDEIVEYGVRMALQMSAPPPGVVLLPPDRWLFVFFTQNPHESAVRSAVRILESQVADKNLLNVKHVVFPVCRDEHWILVVISNPFPSAEEVADFEKHAENKKKPLGNFKNSLYKNWMHGPAKPLVMLFDSLKCKDNPVLPEFYDVVYGDVLHGLCVMHQYYWKRTNRDLALSPEVFSKFRIEYKVPRIQGQTNKADCGVFLMNYTMTWVNVLKEFQGDYWALRDLDFHTYFARYGTHFSRKVLCNAILEDCKKEKPEVAKKLEKLYGSFKFYNPGP